MIFALGGRDREQVGGRDGEDHLKGLCVQAALVSQAEAREEGRKQEGTRSPWFAHFEDAMRRCGPTVSGDAIDAIRDFVRTFENNAADKVAYSYNEAENGEQGRGKLARKHTPHL